MTGRQGTKGPGSGEVWVFGYGSLMWEPGFPHIEARSALVKGYHRALCIVSHFHRGTPERPGLVLGLDRGGSCRGIAFRIAAGDTEAVLDYLDERELVSYAYRRRLLPVGLDDRGVRAYAYVADQTHSQYAGKLSPEESVDFVVQGVGVSGTCFDYLENTVRHLDRLGIEDGPLHRLLARTLERVRQTMAFDV
jgi:cation transport protein ChaC